MQETLDLIELIQEIWRRKWSIFIICVLVGTVGLVVSLVLPKEYQAETSIMVHADSRASSMAGFTTRAFGLAGLGVPGQSSAAYNQILNSNMIFLRVIDKNNLREYYGYAKDNSEDQKLIRMMRERIDVTPIRDQVLYLRYMDKDPNYSALIANTFIDELREYLRGGTKSRAVYTEDFIRLQIDRIHDELTRAEEELKEFTATEDAIGIDEQIIQMVRNASSIRANKTSDMVALSLVREKIRNEKRLRETLDKKSLELIDGYREYGMSNKQPVNLLAPEQSYKSADLSDLPEQLLTDSAVDHIRKNLTDLKIKLLEEKITKTDKHPEVVKLNEEIFRNRDLFIREIGNVVDAQLGSLEYERINLESQIRAYDVMIDRLDNIWSELPDKSMQYIRKKRDVEALSQIYVSLKNEQMEARIQVVREGQYFDILDMAMAPDKPAKPKPITNTITGLLLGFIVGMVWAYLMAAIRVRNRNRNAI